MAGIFGEFFVVSVSWGKKHEKSSKFSGKIWSKTREKIRDEIREIQGTFVLQLSDGGPLQERPLQFQHGSVMWKVGNQCLTLGQLLLKELQKVFTSGFLKKKETNDSFESLKTL